MTSFDDARVAAIFDAYPKAARKKLLALRKLIFDIAARTDGVGELEETLKWGQPSYLTSATKSGSTIRIDAIKGDDTRCAVYFICHTNLVETFRDLYGDRLCFEGNRGIVLDVKEPLPADELGHCIALALTYQLDKRRKRSPDEAKRDPGNGGQISPPPRIALRFIRATTRYLPARRRAPRRR